MTPPSTEAPNDFSTRQLDTGLLNRDARRENALALLDAWLVLKLTWDRFHNDWEGFLVELCTALELRRHHRTGSTSPATRDHLDPQERPPPHRVDTSRHT